MKILVVDDSLSARKLIISFLNNLSYTDVVEANDGIEALELFHKIPGIKLILLDRYMPHMDGLEFIERFKNDPDTQHVSVAMVTSEDNMGEMAKTISEYKADYYITKPVTKEALVMMFAELFPKHND